MTPTSTPRYRVGVIGCGYLGQRVGEAFDDDDRATVTALAEVDAATLTAAGDRLDVDPGARYEDYREMLSGETLDAVFVATPHTLHYDQITAAMDRGLHVLCEKPLTTDLSTARELADRAAESDQVLMVGYQRHLNAAFERARERWADGGADPTFVTAELTQNWIDRFRDAWRTNPELSGGGYLYDSGSHILDAVCWTTGLEPSWVTAEMEFAGDAREVDVRALLTIGFENGTTASVSLFGDAPATREHIHIWDDDGAVYLEGREWEPRTLRVVDADSTTHEPYIRTDGENKARAFLDSVETGAEPPATARDALVVTAISEAAYEAARTGERVPVEY